MNKEKILAVCDHLERSVSDTEYDWYSPFQCFVGHGIKAGILESSDYSMGIRELGFSMPELQVIVGRQNKRNAIDRARAYVRGDIPKVVSDLFDHLDTPPNCLRGLVVY